MRDTSLLTADGVRFNSLPAAEKLPVSTTLSASTAGIGHSIAVQLLEDGANVIINGRNTTGVEQAVAALNNRFSAGRVLPLVADMNVTGNENIAAAAYPSIDILVNNMGTYALSDFFSTSDGDWQRIFEVNARSGVRLARTYTKSMLERGHGQGIFISSEVALTPMASMASMAHYSASKVTQLSISRSLTELTKGTQVTVNSVLPGPTETESLKGFISSVNPELSYLEAERKFMAENHPSSLIYRLAKPHEVANVVAFLASKPAEGGTVPTIA